MEVNINIKIEASADFCAALNNIANTLVAACVAAAPAPSTAPAPVEPAPGLAEVPKEKEAPPKEVKATDDDGIKEKRAELKSLMAKAAKDGKTEEVKNLLKELGVSKLSQIPDDKVEEALLKAGDL